MKSKEMQELEQRWELLKVELSQLEDFYGRIEGDEIHVIHDVQSLMNKLETGDYHK